MTHIDCADAPDEGISSMLRRCPPPAPSLGEEGAGGQHRCCISAPSSFSFLLATDKSVILLFWSVCGSSSTVKEKKEKKNQTCCRFSPTLLISLSFLSLFFCFPILSAPHLAFLGSHSHYATLAGTRPYISEYPVLCSSSFNSAVSHEQWHPPPTLLFYFSSSYLYSSLSKGGGSGGGVYWTNKPETMWSNQSQSSLPLPPLSCKVCTTADSSLAELSVSCSHSTAFISLMIISDNRRDYSETHQPQIYLYIRVLYVSIRNIELFPVHILYITSQSRRSN